MDELLQPYIGDLESFHSFIEKKWGWKVDYRKEENYLVADENKNYCVCPMADANRKDQLPILCYCSEGFAELMFSKVAGCPVQATVISSIRRGGKTCKYKIEILKNSFYKKM
jgi:hypothetical protein